MTTKPKKPTEGFTIIEVLIVLIIAGIIMLLVFLAIPALSRNSRNTQRRQDAANLIAGVGEFVNDNNGELPTTVSISGNQVTFQGASGTSDVQCAKVGFYKSGNVNLVNTIASVPHPTGNGDIDSMYLVMGATCDNNAVATGTARGYAAVYWIEPGGIVQCQSS